MSNDQIETTNTEIENTTSQETDMQDQDAGSEDMSSEESQMEASVDAEGASGEGTPATEPKKERSPAAHIAFVAAVKAHAEALGLSYKDQKGFAQFYNGETGHKLYVAKQGKAVTRVETTLPILGQPGTQALEKPNGRITCTIDADLAVLEGYLLMLADNSVGKIPAPKRAAKAETAASATVEAAPAAE